MNEIYFLTLVTASERLLILTNPEFHEIFSRTTAGQIAPGIDVRLLTLPEEMQREVDRVVVRASDEMRGDRAAAAAAFEAEEAGERGEDV
ncbi:MAG: hypothetical protein ACRD6W_19780 [Nitrososphaerales archaeon]